MSCTVVCTKMRLGVAVSGKVGELSRGDILNSELTDELRVMAACVGEIFNM